MPSSQVPLNRADSMQRLQLLTCQQEVLRRRLSLQIPAGAALDSPSALTSLSSTPSSRHTSGTWSSAEELDNSAPIPAHPRAGYTKAPPIEPSQVDDSYRLRQVNEQIKATLTELLNTDSARSDERFRAWVQERLLDVEQQIRKQRRRHSGSDREMADAIAMHISLDSCGPRRLSCH
ncbi:uncharacterized protein EI97DRAFT_139208 [Westerdykella ornata]|uniref:Uncharacterized protein n=1 Tax=Westerdykella ornata TaxID=318751 RepID=A0A6A6JE52_WESOR|nr:uncharacterized protein EI97DRAFT_139208 [Westerdykella ornata]KAF2273936.1 hypothetical protein EI97DRAFT_139208 [Westerdykella ornata]